VKRILILLILLVGGHAAIAYPQFQLSRDQMCSSCHLAPEGGGILNENGGVFAENTSQFGTAPEFMYGKIPLPSWLALGGDLRAASGYDKAPQAYLATFPMQAEVYGSAKLPAHLRLYVTLGARPAENGNEAATHAWSREHYLMWSQQEDGSEGWFVRIGRFMPIFGLRYVEHPTYTRQFGGTPLYSETYGAAVEYMSQVFELHATGFIKDPVIDPVAHNNGGALYAEYRVAPTASVGAETMYTKSDIDWYERLGATGKLYLKGPDILLEFEGQLVFHGSDGVWFNQLVSELTATKFLPGGLWLDVGIGHYDENVRIKGLDRDALDVNLHWLTTSHIELIATTRIQLINQGLTTAGTDIGGPTGGYALFQAHYRL